MKLHTRIGEPVYRWSIILWFLFLSLDVGAQPASPRGESAVVPAAAEIGTAGAQDPSSWSRLVVEIDPGQGVESFEFVILMGFDGLDEESGRPPRSERPIYEEVLFEGEWDEPRSIERHFRRDLNWFVVAASTVPPGTDTWMSDPIELDAESVTVSIGTDPVRDAEEAPLVDEAADGDGRSSMNWGGLLAMVFMPLGVVWLFGRDSESDEVPSARRGVEAVVAGLIFVLASDLWLVSFHLDEAFTSTGLMENCDGLANFGDASGWPETRSRLAGVVPAVIGQFVGILDGLRWSSWLFSAGVGAGIFVWAALLGGRLAGWVAIAAALAMGPLTHLPRMLSFYPEMVAVFTWTGVAMTAMVLRPGMRSAISVGLAIGFCGLIDARGLPYVGLFTLMGVLALVLRSGREAKWPIVALLASIVFTWPLGQLAYPASSVALQEQMEQLSEDGRREFVAPSPEVAAEQAHQQSRTVHLSWGRTSLWRIPEAGFELLNSWPEVTEERYRVRGLVSRESQILPWLVVVVGALPIALWGAFRRHRFRGLGALSASVLPTVLLVPFVMVVLVPLVDSPARYMTLLMPALAVCMGIACACLGSLLPETGKFRSGSRFRGPVWGALLVVLVAGWIPNPFAFDAAWRYPWRADDDHRTLTELAESGASLSGEVGERCLREIRNR